MKMMKFICMAFTAILVCTGLASCSSDDDNNDGGGVTTFSKKLVKIVDGDGYGYTFTYDKQGRLTKAADERGDDIELWEYTWSGNAIDAVHSYELYNGIERDSYKYGLSDNKIVSITGSESQSRYKLQYDGGNLSHHEVYAPHGSDGYFTESINDWTWKDGNLVKITSKDGSDGTVEIPISYGDKKCQGYLPSYVISDGCRGIYSYFPDYDNPLFMANPDVTGLVFTQLPEKIVVPASRSDAYSAGTYTFSYVLDKDGYVTSCTVNKVESGNNPNDSGYPYTYTLTWE